MSKIIKYNEEAKGLMKAGMDKVANAVKITLGPMGKNVALESSFGLPTITSDGVSIAKLIELECPFENMGAEIMKEVASRTNDTAGDGTTTTIVLTQSLVTEGLRRVAMGVNAMEVRKEMERASTELVEALKGISRPVRDDEIQSIATISAGSEDLGKIIADTINSVGKEGNITIEDSQSGKIETVFTNGIQLDKGYLSPNFVNKLESQEVELSDVSVLIIDKINTLQDLEIVLEDLKSNNFLIICDDVNEYVLNSLVVAKLQGKIKGAVIKSPGFGDEKKEIAEDLAAALGATIVNKEVKLDKHCFGKANKVVIKKDSTLIVDAKGDYSERVEFLKRQITSLTSRYDRARIQKRIDNMIGKVAIIKVGAATETEMRYLKLRVEDAVNATKAAIEEGIVIGGGAALAKFKPNGDGVGYQIIQKALEAPIRQIAENAGMDGGVILNKVKESSSDMGYDFKSNKLVNMFEAGIIDPVKVTRTALENAISTAAIFLTTEVAIATKYESKTK